MKQLRVGFVKITYSRRKNVWEAQFGLNGQDKVRLAQDEVNLFFISGPPVIDRITPVFLTNSAKTLVSKTEPRTSRCNRLSQSICIRPVS